MNITLHHPNEVPVVSLHTISLLPKITELDYSSLSKEDVLWFHVSVKNPVGVQIVQGLDKLAGNLSDLKIPKIRKSFANSGVHCTCLQNNVSEVYLVRYSGF